MVLNLQKTLTRPVFPFPFRRHISQAKKYPRQAPGTSERPPAKWVDPLASAAPDTIAVTSLEDSLTFIHRPPPTAPSPRSLTTNPISPLLRPQSSAQDSQAALPPLLRSQTSIPPSTRVSHKVIDQIRELRFKNPSGHTRGNLARRFGVSQSFVGAVAALKKPERKRRIKMRDEIHERKREQWSEKHQLTMAIRKKRREMW